MKKKLIIVLTVVLCIGIFSSIGKAAFSQPGASDDPLVTLSYIEKRIEQLKYYIDDKISNNSSNPSSDLEVVEIEQGQSIIGKTGTEIILRGGKAKTIASQLGGLSDITAGVDLKMGQTVPANHMLIVPRNDERGVYAVEKAIFLVRGQYEIK